MQDKLRNDINRQHAPERLVNETIEKLHAPQKKKNTVVYALPTVILVAAVLFVCINLSLAKDQMRYNEVSFLVLRDIASEESVEVEYVSLGEGSMVIKKSENGSVAPEELLNGKKTTIDEKDVYLGSDKEGSYYMAAFCIDDIHYFFYARDCEKQEFEKYLKNFLEE